MSAWAVGECNDSCGEATLIGRWNDTAWRMQASPSPVGDYRDGSRTHSLIEHFG